MLEKLEGPLRVRACLAKQGGHWCPPWISLKLLLTLLSSPLLCVRKLFGQGLHFPVRVAVQMGSSSLEGLRWWSMPTFQQCVTPMFSSSRAFPWKVSRGFKSTLDVVATLIDELPGLFFYMSPNHVKRCFASTYWNICITFWDGYSVSGVVWVIPSVKLWQRRNPPKM